MIRMDAFVKENQALIAGLKVTEIGNFVEELRTAFVTYLVGTLRQNQAPVPFTLPKGKTKPKTKVKAKANAKAAAHAAPAAAAAKAAPPKKAGPKPRASTSAALDRIVAAVKGAGAKGVTSEQLRKDLGLEKSVFQNAVAKAIAAKSLKKSGERRGTKFTAV